MRVCVSNKLCSFTTYMYINGKENIDEDDFTGC